MIGVPFVSEPGSRYYRALCMNGNAYHTDITHSFLLREHLEASDG